MTVRIVAILGLVAVVLSSLFNASASAYNAANSLQQGQDATPPATPLTYEEQQALIEEQQATIEDLEAKVAELEQRIIAMSGGQQTAGQSTTAAAPVQVGEVFTWGDWEITVTGYELAPTIDSTYEQNVARGIYCIVYFTVTNVGTSAVVFPYDQLQLTSDDGRTYVSDWDTLFNLVYVIFGVGTPNIDPLQPGLVYNTGIAFDIPPTATGLALTTQGNAFTVNLSQ